MFGPAAGFTDWKELVYSLRSAEIDYEKTLSEEALKTVINTGFGEPFTPKALEGLVMSDALKARALHRAAKGDVPAGVRFLISTIDVQAGSSPSFVLHTFGIEPIQVESGWMVDVHHVDMRKLRKSRRVDGDGERKLLDPASYAEDWDILIEEAILATYPLADGSGRRMRVKLVACDSGGAYSATAARLNAAASAGPKVSVTSNAYSFWRKLRDDPDSRKLHTRFHLLKGEPSRDKPMLLKTLPDSQQRDKFAIARGDVPVWAVNSNKAKDQASNMLGREEPGGQVLFPVWHDDTGAEINVDWLYAQLTTEVRETAGWRNPRRSKNEAFDLLSYLIAFFDHPDIRLQHINWTAPPAWAREWDANDYVTGVDGVVVESAAEEIDIAALGADLA
jgi:phage terminase large subunit GpA-like protein